MGADLLTLSSFSGSTHADFIRLPVLFYSSTSDSAPLLAGFVLWKCLENGQGYLFYIFLIFISPHFIVSFFSSPTCCVLDALLPSCFSSCSRSRFPVTYYSPPHSHYLPSLISFSNRSAIVFSLPPHTGRRLAMMLETLLPGVDLNPVPYSSPFPLHPLAVGSRGSLGISPIIRFHPSYDRDRGSRLTLPFFQRN